MEDLVQAVVAIVYDWLRPRAEEGPVSRRVLWLRWTIAVLVPSALVALGVWLVIAVGARWP